jgi:serine/threonine protein kinase
VPTADVAWRVEAKERTAVPTDPIRVQTLFLGAVNLDDADARKAYLQQACGEERELRERVEALLRAHDSPDSILDEPLVSPAKDATKTHPSESGVDVSLAFLEPPQRPGSLGRIGHYEVLEVLGHGGFGIVFRAIDEVLQRVVAVKVLAPHAAATSPARKRFLREARAAAQIKHENVVQVHAVVEEPLPYLVMEFIPGETLQQRMDRTGPLDAPEVLSIGRQIAAGLAAAHEKGLVHRDIKPTNILVSKSPQLQVTITDFGLARAADDASLTRSGIVAGTPMFMAPEQAKGENIDARADLFSLGSVLYTMCSGRPPFRAPGTMAVLKRVCDEEPRPIRQIIPEVPEWLCRIIEKLHSKDREARFQSATEVNELLADCERQLGAHTNLKDLRRIPKRRRPTKERGIAWSKAVLMLALLVVIGAGLFAVVRGKISASRLAMQLAEANAREAQARYEAANYRSPANEKEGWIPLFNGKDLTGWVERLTGGSWHITEDKTLSLSGNGAIFTTQDFDDFHLAAEVLVEGDAESGVYFQCDPQNLNSTRPLAFTAVINSIDRRSPRMGSLSDPSGANFFGEAAPNLLRKWFTYEIIADGEIVTIKVDGKTTISRPYSLPRRRGGRIGLKFPGTAHSIQFRNVSIKPIASSGVNAAVVAALREKADAMQRLLEQVQALHKAGQAPRAEVIGAEVGLAEAKLAIMEAQHNNAERIKVIEGLTKLVEEQKRIVDEMFKAHVVSAAEATAMTGKVADMKARLAKARADAERGGDR